MKPRVPIPIHVYPSVNRISTMNTGALLQKICLTIETIRGTFHSTFHPFFSMTSYQDVLCSMSRCENGFYSHTHACIPGVINSKKVVFR